MAEFVRHHALDLVMAEHREQAGGRRHGRMLRIAAGGKGVGLGLVDDIDFRHRQLRALGEVSDQIVEFGVAGGIDLDRVVHFQHDLVGVPVSEQVHARSDQQGDDRTAAAAQRIAQNHEQRRQRRQQHGRLHEVHRLYSLE